MARQAPVRDVAPTVQRLRLRYAKRGRVRFSRHRDFQRALERALRDREPPVRLLGVTVSRLIEGEQLHLRLDEDA